jgi:type II secretory pathway pseudopilin PulG
MCLDKDDEIPFSADIVINGGDKLDILTTKDIDASYMKENPNFFVEIDKGSKTHYLRLNLIYKDACDEIKCPNAQTCSLCTINSDPQDFTITCPAADATKGYICNSVDPGDVFEDIADCENAMNCLELFRKFVQSAANECKFECSDETKDLADQLHDKHCTDNPTGELKELCDQLNFNVILASTGEEEDGDKQASGSGGSSDDTVIIVVIVLVVLLILAIAVVLAVMKRKQSQARADAKHAADRAYEQRNQFIQNAAFVAAQQTHDEFQPGVSNPLYDWYRPDMNRNDADVYLAGQGEGAFVVRDSSATPGWHLLCIKTQNKVLHDQIRMTDEGMYELLPTMEDGIQVAQPKFHELPELIDHYVEQHDDVQYTLALANPIYDNHNLMQARLGYTQAGYADVEAPSLPNKGPDVDGVANPMYGAGMDATYDASSGAYTGGPGYLDVSGAPGYLDVAGTQQATQVDPAQTAYMDVAPEESLTF